ncbi:hypothetical protein Tco_0004231 [Tanacetum coccineum]
MQNIPYASAVGSIMYVVRCTHPDVAFAQNITSRFQQNPGDAHWTAVKNILKYLRNTKDMFLVYGGDTKRELRTGYVFILNGGAVDWKSTKQSIFATSSTDAEYIAAFDASKEAVWIRKFIFGLGVVPTIEEPINMYCDNIGPIAIAKDHGVTKDDNLAGPFTKALAFSKHSELTENVEMILASRVVYFRQRPTAKGVGLRVVDSHTGNHPEDGFRPLETIRRLLVVIRRRSHLDFEGEAFEPERRMLPIISISTACYPDSQVGAVGILFPISVPLYTGGVLEKDPAPHLTARQEQAVQILSSNKAPFRRTADPREALFRFSLDVLMTAHQASALVAWAGAEVSCPCGRDVVEENVIPESAFLNPIDPEFDVTVAEKDVAQEARGERGQEKEVSCAADAPVYTTADIVTSSRGKTLVLPTSGVAVVFPASRVLFRLAADKSLLSAEVSALKNVVSQKDTDISLLDSRASYLKSALDDSQAACGEARSLISSLSSERDGLASEVSTLYIPFSWILRGIWKPSGKKKFRSYGRDGLLPTRWKVTMVTMLKFPRNVTKEILGRFRTSRGSMWVKLATLCSFAFCVDDLDTDEDLGSVACMPHLEDPRFEILP